MAKDILILQTLLNYWCFLCSPAIVFVQRHNVTSDVNNIIRYIIKLLSSLKWQADLGRQNKKGLDTQGTIHEKGKSQGRS